MLRNSVADPYGADELKRIIPELLRLRMYVRAFVHQYSEVFKAQNGPGDKGAAVSALSVGGSLSEQSTRILHEDRGPRPRPDVAEFAADGGSAFAYEALTRPLSGDA